MAIKLFVVTALPSRDNGIDQFRLFGSSLNSRHRPNTQQNLSEAKAKGAGKERVAEAPPW